MKKIIVLVFVTILMSAMVINAGANSKPLADNTASFPGSVGLINPCNGEIVVGTIDIHLTVSTAETGNGAEKVNVHVNWKGTLTGNKGNEYQFSLDAMDHFDSFSTFYDTDWDAQVIGKGNAPDFLANGHLRVFVNGQNDPIAVYTFGSVGSSCK